MVYILNWVIHMWWEIKKVVNIYIFFFAAKATYLAIQKTYSYLTPDLWKENILNKSPYQEYSDYLMITHKAVGAGQQRQEQVAA